MEKEVLIGEKKGAKAVLGRRKKGVGLRIFFMKEEKRILRKDGLRYLKK